MGSLSDIAMGIRLFNLVMGMIRQYRATEGEFDISTAIPTFLTGLGQVAGIKELSADNISVLTPLLVEMWDSIRELREPSAGKL